MSLEAQKDSEARMTLLEHLHELRSRLWRALLAVLACAAIALYFARDLFWFLMRPVLAALPESQRALVYTSGIEEINVLLKVGFYAGIFLGAPVILYQLWQFVSPGLLPSERRMVGPFVLGGTLFFLGGAAFCYAMVLPTMFQFLLKPAAVAGLRERVESSAGAGDDAMRLIAIGRPEPATARVADARALLAGGATSPAPPPAADALEARERLRRLAARLDVAAALSHKGSAQDAIARAIARRADAEQNLAHGAASEAAASADDAAVAVAEAIARQSGDPAGAAFRGLWDLDRALAAAAAQVAREEWTRPMLTMREQLSLVLFLELAFGMIFELPLLMALLAALGILKAAWLAKYQRHALVACVLVAALITPSGDAVNLTLMAAPMFLCFELGLAAAYVLGRRRAEKLREDERALAATPDG